MTESNNNERRYYVYEWFFKDTGEVFYVGKGTKDRYKTTHNRDKFFKDMHATHECDVRITHSDLTEEEAYSLEYDTIKYYRENTDYRLTNQTDGGDGTRGLKVSEETKKKMSISSKKKWEDEEWKQKVIDARHQPDSTYQSEEFKAKISSLVTGEKNPNYGHHWTDEMKERASKQRKQSGRYEKSKNPKSKIIQCVETQEYFTCITYAMERYGVKWPASFSIALDNPNRTAAGLHWITVE